MVVQRLGNRDSNTIGNITEKIIIILTKFIIQQDHVQSLESLKAELAMVTDKRTDLERRLTVSLKDKDNLMQQLDEANDRIVALERQLKEQVRKKRIKVKFKKRCTLTTNNIKIEMEKSYLMK